MESLEQPKFRFAQAFRQLLVWISYFIGAVTLMIVFLPLLKLSSARQRVPRVRWAISIALRTMTFFTQVMRILGKIQVQGLEKLPKNGNYILIANHPSFYDVILLLGFFPKANCVVNRKLLNQPFYGPLIRLAHYIPNDTAGFQQGLHGVQAHGASPLIIFPEGTRGDGQFKSFSRGAARIALELQIPIHPVVISYSAPFMKKGVPWYYSFSKPVNVSFSFDHPIPPRDEFGGNEIPMTIRSRHYTQQLQDYFY